MSNNKHWQVEAAFGPEAMVSVIGVGTDPQAAITDDQVVKIAHASAIPYWTDGKRLWTSEGPAKHKGAHPISAAEALSQFSLAALVEAREFGSTP